MKLDVFLTAVAIMAAIFGLGFLIVPAQLTELYGVALTPGAQVVGRTAGAAFIAVAIVYWGARNGEAGQMLKAALMGGLISMGLNSLIMVQATWAGVVNSLGWAQAAFNGLLALGFAYFIFGKRKGA